MLKASSGTFEELARQSWVRLSGLSTGTYLLLIAGIAAALSLTLATDFGESRDVLYCERRGRLAYDFYVKGFDAAALESLRAAAKLYGHFFDILVTIVQDAFAKDRVNRFELRVLLQGLFNLSSLIPVFLISARVVSRPLAFVAVILVLATPMFFGHAFINPKDSIFSTMLLWSLYLILHCYGDEKRPSYWALCLLGVVLGLTLSQRAIGAYLVLLVAALAVVLPAGLRAPELGLWKSLGEVSLQRFAGLSFLLLVVFTTYVMAMPGILAELELGTISRIASTFSRFPWQGHVRYFGTLVPAQNIPWHYVYGFLLVQLPLYYHLFLLVPVVWFFLHVRRSAAEARTLCQNYRALSALFAMALALIIPLLLILIIRPVLYHNIRQVLFLAPLLCMLLFFAFVWAMKEMPYALRIVLGALALMFWVQAVAAMVRLHPYEYIYYNPLVAKPVRGFNLDYWSTSLRELAGKINDYAEGRADKLRLRICGRERFLAPYLDADKVDVVEQNADLVAGQYSDLTRCLRSLGNHWDMAITVSREGSILAGAAVPASSARQ